MEAKWMAIAWAVFMLGLCGSKVYEDKTRAECRIAFSQTTKTAEEIEKICGK